ncbi:MAG: hypothetical protein GF398_08260 [Chitinivibrionales bacterium]|nr:hypothetical protein [Chitinivibrionales bacterium]
MRITIASYKNAGMLPSITICKKLQLTHERVLGSSVYVPEAFSLAYDRHHKLVNETFRGHPNFIELNIADGIDTKEKLGAFLSLPMAGTFERKDCFYTWCFKIIASICGWERINAVRAEHRELYVRGFGCSSTDLSPAV